MCDFQRCLVRPFLQTRFFVDMYLTSSELHLGEIGLECSRAGAAGVAFSGPLCACSRLSAAVNSPQVWPNAVQAALRLFDLLQNDPGFMTGLAPELDIVVWAPKASSASEVSRLSEELFQRAAAANLHMAKANLPKYLFESSWSDFEWDQEHVTCLRNCLMKPEHLDWIDRIWAALNQAMNNVAADD